MNCIGGVMVNVLASSAVDGGFEPRSGQSKDYKNDICCFPVKDAALRRKTKTGWLRIRILFPTVATCLSAETVFQ